MIKKGRLPEKGSGGWQKAKALHIDKAFCGRTAYALEQLHLSFDGIAHDAGMPSKSQLIEIKNFVLEPSKRVVRYLCRKGFSAHWLFTGKGSVYAVDESIGAAGKTALIERIRGDIAELQRQSVVMIDKSTELSKILNLLLKTKK